MKTISFKSQSQLKPKQSVEGILFIYYAAKLAIDIKLQFKSNFDLDRCKFASIFIMFKFCCTELKVFKIFSLKIDNS